MNQPGLVPPGPLGFGPPGPPGFGPPGPPRPSIKNKIKNTIVILIAIFLLFMLIWLIFLKKDGTFSDWSEWTTCDKECGGGKQNRTRIYTPPSWGGADLPDKDQIIEEQECKKDPCPIDGYMTSWENDGVCSTPCRGEKGTQKQIRNFIPQQHGGIDPIDKDILTQEIDCNLELCKSAPAKVTE